MQPHEANYLKLDCSKAYRFLKWRTIYDIHETIVNTINWYKSYYYDNVDVFNLCLEQIRNYIATAKRENMHWVSMMDI